MLDHQPPKAASPPGIAVRVAVALLIAAGLTACGREPVRTVVIPPASSAPAGPATQAAAPASRPATAAAASTPQPSAALDPAPVDPLEGAIPPAMASLPGVPSPAAPAGSTETLGAGPADPTAAAPKTAAGPAIPPASGGTPMASLPGLTSPPPRHPQGPAPARQAAASPQPLPEPSAAPPASLSGLYPDFRGPLGDPEGARLLAARKLVVPVMGIAPKALADHYDDRRGKRVHEAMDIMAPRGTPVVAVDDGTVAKLFNSRGGGLTLYHFDPTGRLTYYYAHLDRYAEGMQEGRALRQGEVIGYVGYTGNANPAGPHLHFAVFRLPPERRWWQGEAVNPYPAFRNAKAVEVVAAK